MPDFRHTASLARCQSRSFLASILNGGHWPGAALNAFTCVHKFRRYFEGVTPGFLQAAHLLGIVRENVTNKQFWVVGGKSQSDINSSSFEEVETHGPCCQRGGQEVSQLPVNRNFPPQHFPSLPSATLIPHIYFKLSTYFPFNTFPPHFSVLYFYLKLFPQISVVAPRTVNLIRGRYLLSGEHITMLFHWRKIQHKNRILQNIEKYMSC